MRSPIWRRAATRSPWESWAYPLIDKQASYLVRGQTARVDAELRVGTVESSGWFRRTH